MSSNNFKILAKQLQTFGFEEDNFLEQSLETLMDRGLPTFELYTEAYFDLHTKIEAKLYFILTDTPGFYRFDKYLALLRYTGEPDKDRAQTFYLHEGLGIPFREAFNLLQGRSVCKEFVNSSGEQFSAWVSINFDADKDNRNDYFYTYVNTEDFDLEKVLNNYPLTALDMDKTRESMIRFLKQGSRYLATFKGATRNHRVYIEANPAGNSLNIKEDEQGDNKAC